MVEKASSAARASGEVKQKRSRRKKKQDDISEKDEFKQLPQIVRILLYIFRLFFRFTENDDMLNFCLY